MWKLNQPSEGNCKFLQVTSKKITAFCMSMGLKYPFFKGNLRDGCNDSHKLPMEYANHKNVVQ